MTSQNLLRLTALGLAGYWSMVGCDSAAPRRLEIPADARPIGAESLRSGSSDETHSARAQYEQPHMTRPARITRLNSGGDETTSSIREPNADVVEVETSPESTHRSQFVPIVMPAPAPQPAIEPAPLLPSKATFRASLAEGPQLMTPSRPVLKTGLGVRESEVKSQVTGDTGQRWESIEQRSSITTFYAPSKSQQPQPAGQAAAMQVVSQRAMQIADKASALADRGMLYSARTELWKALELIAQALDAQEADARHGSALAAAVTALDEARELAQATALPGENANVAVIAASHRTPHLESFQALSRSPIVAQQQYFAQAQQHLAIAAGNLPAASQILYRLGRLQSAIAALDADPLSLHGPQSMVFHQSALAVDSKNWLAANELGVLYARYGQLPESRQLLVHSVTVHPHLEGWHNLAIVHRRLGEADLAARAESEWRLLAQRTGKSRTDAAEMVRWVDPKAFASTGGPEVHWPAEVAVKSTANASSPLRR